MPIYQITLENAGTVAINADTGGEALRIAANQFPADVIVPGRPSALTMLQWLGVRIPNVGGPDEVAQRISSALGINVQSQSGNVITPSGEPVPRVGEQQSPSETASEREARFDREDIDTRPELEGLISGSGPGFDAPSAIIPGPEVEIEPGTRRTSGAGGSSPPPATGGDQFPTITDDTGATFQQGPGPTNRLQERVLEDGTVQVRIAGGEWQSVSPAHQDVINQFSNVDIGPDGRLRLSDESGRTIGLDTVSRAVQTGDLGILNWWDESQFGPLKNYFTFSGEQILLTDDEGRPILDANGDVQFTNQPPVLDANRIQRLFDGAQTGTYGASVQQRALAAAGSGQAGFESAADFLEGGFATGPEGRGFFRGAPGDPFRALPSRSIEDIIVDRLLAGDTPGALELQRFANQPTDQERLDRALEVARSPADQFTLSLLSQGQAPLPELAQDGSIRRVGPIQDAVRQAANEFNRPPAIEQNFLENRGTPEQIAAARAAIEMFQQQGFDIPTTGAERPAQGQTLDSPANLSPEQIRFIEAAGLDVPTYLQFLQSIGRGGQAPQTGGQQSPGQAFTDVAADPFNASNQQPGNILQAATAAQQTPQQIDFLRQAGFTQALFPPGQREAMQDLGLGVGVQQGALPQFALPVALQTVQQGGVPQAAGSNFLTAAGIRTPSGQALNRLSSGDLQILQELGRLAGIPQQDFARALRSGQIATPGATRRSRAFV